MRYRIRLWTQAPGAGAWYVWADGNSEAEAIEAAVADTTPHPDGWPVLGEAVGGGPLG